MKTTEELFWSKVSVGWTDECWLWLGSKSANGYGSFTTGHNRGIGSLPHRISHEMLKGPVNSGAVIDHLCRVRLCVNPAHLEAVSQRENVLRERASNGDARIKSNQNTGKTTCKNGHSEWDDRYDRRTCIPCRREGWRKANARRSEGNSHSG